VGQPRAAPAAEAGLDARAAGRLAGAIVRAAKPTAVGAPTTSRPLAEIGSSVGRCDDARRR
jgi:hypothetical protein